MSDPAVSDPAVSADPTERITTVRPRRHAADLWRRRRRAGQSGRGPRPVPAVDVVVGLLVIVGLLVQAVVTHDFRVPRVGVALPVVASLVAVLGVARGLVAVGPLIASRAETTWILSAPVDRRQVLLPRVGLTLGATAVVGVFIGLATAAVVPGATVTGSIVLDTASLIALVAVGILVQPEPGRRRMLRGALDVALVVALGFAVFAIVARRPARVVLAVLGDGSWWGLALVVVAVAVGLPMLARLGRTDRAALTRDAPLVAALATTATWLDPQVLDDALTRRRAAARGRVRSARLRGGRTAVLLRAEVARVRRRPLAFGILVGTGIAAWAWWRITPAPVAAFGHVVLAYAAVRPFSHGLDEVCRNRALRFLLGGTDRSLRRVHLVLPVVVAVAWAAATTPVAGVDAPLTGLLCVVGSVAAIHRVATRPAPEFAGGVVDTPFGLIPVDLLRQVLRGPVVLAVAAALAAALS